MSDYYIPKEQRIANAQREVDNLWHKYMEVKSRYGDTNPALIHMWYERYCKAKKNLDELQKTELLKPNEQITPKPNEQTIITCEENGLFNNVWTLVVGIICSICISVWILNGESSWIRGICVLFTTGILANVGLEIKNTFGKILFLIGMIGALSIFISFFYGIWYWICGGFLIVGGDWLPFANDNTFLETAVDMVLSLIPLGFIIGFIAILFGWNPFK